MADRPQEKRYEPPTGGHQFGTFEGVYTPALLTILGLVMFMRTNFVLGYAGLSGMLVILAVGSSITLVTGLAISAISTNTEVRGGGAYFLISRVLGPSFGTSIGLTLFLSQTLAIAFNVVGAVEAIVNDFPSLRPYFLYLNLGIGGALFWLVWKGADWAVRAQFFIMAVLGASTLCFMLGPIGDFSWANLAANWSALGDSPRYMTFFAIFFPAVTGIMAGVNMSGDLKDPHRSIPRGTLLALATAVGIYLVQMILAAGCFDRREMIERPYLILVDHACWGLGFMVLAGVQAATLSTALGWMMGAPRVLQSLGVDNVLPGISCFRQGVGKTNEPRRAMLVVIAIAAVILIWSGFAGRNAESTESSPINLMSELVSLFFLFTYAIINLAAFVESLGRNPSFRPRFRYFHWSLAAYGVVSCTAAAMLIDFTLSIVALVVISGLYFWTRLRNLEMSYGDARRGFLYSRIHSLLLQLSTLPRHPKNWRPTITVLCSDLENRGNLVDYAVLLSQRRGIITVMKIAELPENADLHARQQAELGAMREVIRRRNWPVFPAVVVASVFDRALQVALQSHSLGPLRPNIIFMGWPQHEERVDPFFRHLELVVEKLKLNAMVLANNRLSLQPLDEDGTIDIWWRTAAGGSLMTILGYLVQLDRNWRKTTLRIFLAPPAAAKAQRMEKLLDSARIEAELIPLPEAVDFATALADYSAQAELVFMEFPPEDWKCEERRRDFHRSISAISRQAPPYFLVASNGEADLLA